jgi:hypothetical protein
MFLEESTCIVVETLKGKWDIVDKFGLDEKNFCV